MQKAQFTAEVLVHKDKMYRFALSFMGNEEEARDLVQDVLLKLWESRNQLGDIRSIEAWCMTLIRNKALDKLKRAERKLRVVSENGRPDERWHAHEESPQRAFENKELGSMIEKAMEALPEKQRSAFHLRDVQGYSYMEICELTETEMNQVKVNIFRARKALQSALQNAISDGHGMG